MSAQAQKEGNHEKGKKIVSITFGGCDGCIYSRLWSKKSGRSRK